MSAIASRDLARAARRIDVLAAQQLPTQRLIEGVADELHSAMAVDGMFMAATDPDTMLGLGAGVVHGLPDAVCGPFWEYEFEVPDFNKFTDLARAPRHAADLHAATGGRPERSARWRHLRTLMDADGELRATFNAGGRGWGLLHLVRGGTTRGFAQEEVAFVETIAPTVGRALRLSLISHPAERPAGCGPGMAVLDAGSRLISATPEALTWFEALESVHRCSDPVLGVELPSEVAPLIVEAYELTSREVDVTRALARGLTTNEIALELHLSRYTVQDHLKSVYEKTGVSSRGELVAKMFADHYHDGVVEALHRAPVMPVAPLAAAA